MFSSIDTRGDKRVLAAADIFIPDQYHVDIQELIKLDSRPNFRDGMGKLAKAIIDESYGDMKKKKFPSDRHHFWEEMPLAQINLYYAAVDRCVSYELLRRIIDTNNVRCHLRASPRSVVCPSCKANVESTRRKKKPMWDEDRHPIWEDDVPHQ